MKILIIGLGIIGGSYAEGLSKAGHMVYGVDLNEDTLQYAINNHYICAGSKEASDYIGLVDLIVLGLYPEKVLPFLAAYQAHFHQGQVITDVCGVKTPICIEATKLALPASFVGSHPMAGKEKQGIQFADCRIFKGTNFLICPIEDTKPEAIKTVKLLAEALEFGKIHLITPNHHDRMIAYTSQLTHALAVSLVNSETSQDVTSFIGDSYRDLTRIAMINEELWCELFMQNKESLLAEIDSFEQQLERIKKAVLKEDKESLKACFKESKKKREMM